MARVLRLIVLALGVIASGVGTVYVKHLSRTLFVELQVLQRDGDELAVEWGRLELEQSTWATHDRVVKLADERLGLYVPPGDSVVLVDGR